MGNGGRKRPRFPRLESPDIAHNEVVASAKCAAVEASERVFLRNRGSTVGKFAPARKKKFSGAPNQNGEQFSVELIIRL
jgi:hypothetical protein